MTADLHQRLLAELDDSRALAEWGCGCDPLAAALRAVVERHPPRVIRVVGQEPLVSCARCSKPYPCGDIATIAGQLGLTEGNDR